MSGMNSKRYWALFTVCLIGLSGFAKLWSSKTLTQREPASTSAPAYDPAQGSVELHSHIFMHEGMGFMFHGDFEGPLHATDWTSRFDSQVNPETLNRSNIGILVVSLYALPVLTSPKEAIRKEVADAEKFVRDYPEWIIARSPEEARQGLANGKRIMILSLENADGVLDSEEDLREFVDQKGIRIVTFLHLMDNDYGGAAFLRSYHALSNPLGWGRTLEHMNPKGLEPKGRELLKQMIAHKVWIDLAHASDESRKAMTPVIRAAGQPLLYTHGSLRKYYGAERGLSEQQVLEVKESGGIIGLLPSQDMLEDTQVTQKFCPPGCSSEQCTDGVHAFAQQYSEMAALLGNSADHLSMGSDFNGGIPHLQPSCGTKTELDREGLWNISQVPELWKALANLGVQVPTHASVREAFLSAWEKVMKP